MHYGNTPIQLPLEYFSVAPIRPLFGLLHLIVEIHHTSNYFSRYKPYKTNFL